MSIGEIQLSHQNITVNTIQVAGQGQDNSITLFYVFGKMPINNRIALCLKEYNRKNIQNQDDFNKTLKEGRLVVVKKGGESFYIHNAWHASSKDCSHHLIIMGDKPKMFVKESLACELTHQDYDLMQKRYANCEVFFPKNVKIEHKSKSS